MSSGRFFANLHEQEVPELFAAATKCGLRAESFSATAIDTLVSQDLLFVEAHNSGKEGALTDSQIDALEERVRLGANLLLTLGRDAGKLPMRMSRMLPTMAWGAQIGYPEWLSHRPCTTGWWDEALFPKNEPAGLKLPYFYPIRPVSAAERGEGRYERYAWKIQKMDRAFQPGSDTWTRPLLNRNWTVRLAANDRGQSPLLITGRYGKGRVAVLAGSSTAFTGSPAAGPFWDAVLVWMMEARSAIAPVEAASQLSLAVSATRSKASITITNPSSREMQGELVARLLSWEGAYLEDASAPDAGVVKISALGKTVVEFNLPQPSSTGAQVLEWRHALQLRVGLISADGSTLLVEQRTRLDLEPALQLRVLTDDLNSMPSPFHAPDGNTLAPFRSRMGASVKAYAYKVGGRVNVQVEASNGLKNLAPMAGVIDVGDPKNESVMALNDEATNFRKSPIDGIQAYSMWSGKQGKDNQILFSFTRPVMLASIVIVGSDGGTAEGRDHNPDQAVIFVDGKQVTSTQLEPLFLRGNGRATISFAPRVASKITIRFPWIAAVPGRRRLQPWLGEIELNGWLGDEPPPVKDALVVSLTNAMTGEQKEVHRAMVELAPGERKLITASFDLPQDALGFGAYQLTAKMHRVEESVPLLALKGENALRSITDILPNDGAMLGFIVTRGFRTIFDVGTGTKEILAGWAQPDDLIWAYSRQLKQVHQNARTAANRLYVTDDDMRHYSTPWKSYPNGEFFYDVATPLLVERMQAQANWSKSAQVRLEHSDRWDTGPETQSLHSWEDYVEFDRELRRRGKPGLKGRTRTELGAEIHAEHEAEWQAWHLGRYTDAVTKMREAFEAHKKQLTIVAQGLPIVAGSAAAKLSPTIRGMSDDSTWGMVSDSIPLTTGRQLAEIAYNPVWSISTQGMWGYTSGVLQNEHWHSPVSTTEPARRAMYDRAWRGMVWSDGRYGSVYSFGYNSNVGTAYTMNDNDWRQWWFMQQRHSLLVPEEPIGAGLVLSSSFYAQPEHTKFSCGEALDANELLPIYARTFENLQMAGVSLAFGANAASLDKWKGSAPLVLLNPGMFNTAEVGHLVALHERGVRIAAFAGGDLGAAAELLKRPRIVLIEGEAKDFSLEQAMMLRPKIHAGLKLPVIFPEGTTGYGFRMGKMNFVVLEDWSEEGREATLRVSATSDGSSARACDMNDHRNLPIHRDGEHWVMTVPLRSGDGALIAFEEVG